MTADACLGGVGWSGSARIRLPLNILEKYKRIEITTFLSGSAVYSFPDLI